METKNKMLEKSVVLFLQILFDGIGILEDKRHEKIYNYSKNDKSLEKIIVNSAEYVSGTYFFPKLYGLKENRLEFLMLINDLEDNSLYQSIYIKNKLEMNNIDKRRSAYLALVEYYQIIFWKMVEDKTIKKFRRKIKNHVL